MSAQVSLLIYEAPGGAVLLRAQAVIEMTTNRCETTAKSCSGGTHGTRTYHCEFILVSYTTLANHATAGNSA